MKSGDRVKINIDTGSEDIVLGTILDANFLGIGLLVKCDKQHKTVCLPNTKEIIVHKDDVEVLDD